MIPTSLILTALILTADVHDAGAGRYLYLLCAIVLLGGGALSFVLARLKRRESDLLELKANLELMVAERTRALEEAIAAAEALARTDALTGLLNRRAFDERLAELHKVSLRYVRNYSVLLIDIDRFKLVNDTYGHDAGDLVLVAFARLIKIRVRSTDVLARYGGEEFAILIPETSVAEAYDYAEALRAAIASTPVTLEDGLQLQVTASIGVSGYDAERMALSRGEIVRLADAKLYEAKQTGRNRVCRVVEVECSGPVGRGETRGARVA